MGDVSLWSAVATGWSELWGAFARPAHDALVTATGIDAGTRVLDVGCGSGEFLALLREIDAEAVGVDPAAGMRQLAASRGVLALDGEAEHLPAGDGRFDVVTAVNVLQFADDARAALREFARVLRPGGRIGVATWAEPSHNDLDVIERAVAVADETEPAPDGPPPGLVGLADAFAEAGLTLTASGIVEAAWTAPDDDTLVRGILLGESEAFIREMRPVVLAAAAPFLGSGGYVLRNALRWAVGAPLPRGSAGGDRGGDAAASLAR